MIYPEDILDSWIYVSLFIPLKIMRESSKWV